MTPSQTIPFRCRISFHSWGKWETIWEGLLQKFVILLPEGRKIVTGNRPARVQERICVNCGASQRRG